MTNTVATTILSQLGGNRFIAMTGACKLIGSPNALTFKIGRNARNITHVTVTLTAMDDYQVEFLNVRAGKISPVAYAEGVYADNLAEVFTDKTGLDTHL